MTSIYLSTAYLAPIEYYQKMNAADMVFIEKNENYIKQTYRNRCVIASPNGRQTLSIPIEKSESPKCLIRDVRISNHDNWQHIHWNAMVSAYNSTPFFEYYEDYFYSLYKTRPKFLFDFNEKLRSIICDLLDLDLSIKFTDTYAKDFVILEQDQRNDIHPKKPSNQPCFKPYYQVFDGKLGFQSNLSIVDLLFNMGPEAILWL
ncbi:hypothetical protein AwDysgo_06120 [Bacteroidales bacterium]|nr:hypothetical protein AwDysgo_06120 [Bacteroidales bacterium]